MKYIIVYLIWFFIFCGWLAYEQRKSQRKQQKESDAFWAREQQANSTRNKDISHLPLLQVDTTQIPLTDTDQESIQYYVKQVQDLITQPMIDLSAYSNTDLKLAYGVGNFKTLSDYDENFNTFLIALTNLARSYEQEGYHEDAKNTYLAAIHYGSRKVSDYEELAYVYLAADQPEEISRLIRDVENGEHPRKDKIADLLKQVLAKYV